MDWPTNSNSTYHYLCEGRRMQFFLQIIYKIQRKICVEVVPGPGPIIGLEENNNEISNFFHSTTWYCRHNCLPQSVGGKLPHCWSWYNHTIFCLSISFQDAWRYAGGPWWQWQPWWSKMPSFDQSVIPIGQETRPLLGQYVWMNSYFFL
jgi:hypothetical protein